MDVFKDERFKHIAKDPKFKNVPKREHKIKIDKRFQGMFTDNRFKLNYTVDQRGRPIKHSQAEDYKKYYDVSEEEDSDNTIESKPESDLVSINASDQVRENAGLMIKKSDYKLTSEEDQSESSKLSDKVVNRLQDLSVDYARGEGILDTDSSSSDEPTTEESEEEIEHDWGELDKDAEVIDEATHRLAICHLDWDRVTATDVFVLLNSFLPSTGYIKSVTIYPSEFGLQRMKEEELKGPQELTSKTLEIKSDEEGADENDEYHREKLREYQLKRLKYYYAVAVFDSAESANKVYSECDRIEYESSATKLDLRFIPDDMEFDQQARESCTSMPEKGKYKPRLFTNTALQQEKVELTWDETDPNRQDLTRKIAQGAKISESDLKAYIATSSEESDSEHLESGNDSDNSNDDCKDNNKSKDDDIKKFRSLLATIQKEEEKKKHSKVDLEITWDLAVENRTKEREEKNKINSMTPFEKKICKKQNNKYKKESDSDNLLSDDDLPSDIDMDDPFFKDELNNLPNKNTKKRKKKNKWIESHSDKEDKRKAELELLLADDEEEPSRKHFNMKVIQEKEANKHKKKFKKNEDQEEDNFKVDVKDERFSALYTSHLYNIDPADSHFKRTKAMQDLIAEKSRRKLNNYQDDLKIHNKKQRENGPQLSSEISKLVKSVQKKSKLNK